MTEILDSRSEDPSARSISIGAALYVDTENLRDPEYARQVVAAVAANWPGDRPPLGSVSLYVRADKAELWRLWAEGAFPGLRLRVRGVQHFSNNKAKNSADLAITADAVADLMAGQADAVAVVSNDSDFGALFVKVRELAQDAGAEAIPFLWITAPDGGALSAEIEEFIPAAFRWDLSAAPAVSAPAPAVIRPTPKSLPEAARPALAAANADTASSSEAIADELIRQLPVGKFKAAEAQEIVKQCWPKRPVALGSSAKFGQFLSKEIWPVLQKRGVKLTRQSSPRIYEITQSVKDATTQNEPAHNHSTRSQSVKPSLMGADYAAEPTFEQITAMVAAGISEEIFKAADAQTIIKAHWPEHPAASHTQQSFGVWFKDSLWPVMKQHGVVLASEKPRRYEMTPDARHQLTALA